uniref:C2 domain-containing protein n=1 Tax=Glossina brevipalpis TaxID=37001 RepID=A0A1A9WBI9_9MUSC
MFSRKKSEPPKRRNHNLSQFGLTEIPDDFDPSLGVSGADDDNDSDLEAELAAIAGGDGKVKSKPKPKIMPPNDLDKMVAESLKDIGSDDDDAYDDAENDPDLLGELQTISGINTASDDIELTSESENKANDVTEGLEDKEIFVATTATNVIETLKQRIEMYTKAEANAKEMGESSKVRRFGRGLKTLKDLLKQASSGKVINPDDIPPEVSLKSSVGQATADQESNTSEGVKGPITESGDADRVPIRKAPSPPTFHPETQSQSTIEVSSTVNPVIQNMRSLQREYKAAALESKRSGDAAMALQFLKVVKQFDVVIKMCEDGKEVDLSDMPPPPDQFKEFLENMQPKTEEAVSTDQTIPSNDSTKPITANTMLEALEQRLDKYKSVQESAKAEGNASKTRRFGRIVNQYEDAIKAYKAGRSVPYDELPIPPGFGPLPVENATPQSPSSSASSTSSTACTTITPTSPQAQSDPTTPVTSPKAPKKNDDLTTRTSGNQQKNNLAEQQMKILLARQKEFKVAALDAKNAGEIDQAKEYLKIYKGFDALLNAASSGLPVDLSTLPVPPSQRESLEASFAIVTTEDCDPNDDISDIRVRVEEQLAKQLMMCKNTRDHHKAMGDIAGMNRFENLALTVQKDLDLVRYSKRKNFPLPKFHYQKRSFNIVHCNTDLADNELEIVVVRGINYNVPNPKEVDTYVRIECPLLNDETFRAKTVLVKDTESPEYDQRFTVDIVRGNRQFQRIFKRHGVKFEVFSRGCAINCCGLNRILPICCFRGFLRSDNLIGTATVKLQPLETKCDIHDTFNLMEGRKVIGGKLEIKLRLRNPILTKQLEHLEEKWLVIDS